MTPLHLAESDLMNPCDQGANLDIQDDDGVILNAGRLEFELGPFPCKCSIAVEKYVYHHLSSEHPSKPIVRSWV